jgi:hypothetical protein
MTSTSICRVWEISGGDARQYRGSSFFVTDELLISANHVFRPQGTGRFVLTGQMFPGERPVDPLGVSTINPAWHIDATVLRLREPADAALPLDISFDPLTELTEVAIYGFSNEHADPDRISVKLTKYVGAFDAFTAIPYVPQGVSGGPALKNGKVVGVVYGRYKDQNETYILPIRRLENDLMADLSNFYKRQPIEELPWQDWMASPVKVTKILLSIWLLSPSAFWALNFVLQLIYGVSYWQIEHNLPGGGRQIDVFLWLLYALFQLPFCIGAYNLRTRRQSAWAHLLFSCIIMFTPSVSSVVLGWIRGDISLAAIVILTLYSLFLFLLFEADVTRMRAEVQDVLKSSENAGHIRRHSWLRTALAKCDFWIAFFMMFFIVWVICFISLLTITLAGLIPYIPRPNEQRFLLTHYAM